MGSGTQVLLPLLLAVAFWVKSDDPLGAGIMIAWAGTSAQDASVYIGDAVAQQLPLIGGVHDWGTLLGPEHLDALYAAPALARLVWVTELLLTLAGCGVIGWHGWTLWEARDQAGAAPTGPPTSWSLDADGR
ncbi:hypothetical protein BH23ACT9_BH23ACT9_12510 [soil metagenome]